MARIRSIKPEFWTSEQVMELSPVARLAFVGMWNFCDDGGNHPASVKTLKAEVFPADDLPVSSIDEMVQEMIAAGLLVEYEAQAKRWWHVTGWHHQRIDQPTYKYPGPDGHIPAGAPKRVERQRAMSAEQGACSVDVTAKHPECSASVAPPEGKGREGSKPTDAIASVVASKPATPACPHQEIVAAYHEILPMLPTVREWTDARQRLLRTRWSEKPVRQSVEWWRKFFGHVAESDFLTGRGAGTPGRDPFVADLEWLVSPKNFVKVIEGKYHRGDA